jgi:hypothetical protein
MIQTKQIDPDQENFQPKTIFNYGCAFSLYNKHPKKEVKVFV